MCEIFFMVSASNQKLTKTQITSFLRACLPASNSNNDGWGAFWERPDYHGVVKSPYQFKEADIPVILNRYRGSRFFALHLRNATSEVCYNNTHPFKVNDIRGCHNGVVIVNGVTGGCDSLNMLELIGKQTGLVKDKIAKAMTEVSGSYSVLIHAINEGKLYYYRNSPCFGFMLDKNNKLIYGATKIERLEVLVPKLFGMFSDSLIAKPVEDKVYSIDLNTGVFSVVGEVKEYEFKPVVSQSKVWGWGWKRDYENNRGV